MNLSIIIPVYNSANSLPSLMENLNQFFKINAAQYELILINDGSRDNSWQVISDLCDQHGWIRGINLIRNYGQHNALLCGIRQAKYDVIVSMDDDLQQPPEEIPKLLDKLNKGYDVVYGTPQKEKHGLR